MADERPASPAVQAKFPAKSAPAPQRTAEAIHARTMKRPSEPLRLASHGLAAARPKPPAPPESDTPLE